MTKYCILQVIIKKTIYIAQIRRINMLIILMTILFLGILQRIDFLQRRIFSKCISLEQELQYKK